MLGDVRDFAAVNRALQNIDVVYHLAARVGVGQSMYEIAEYTSVNNVGTAVLLESLIKSRVERVVVASSMSIYGEGMYRNQAGRTYDAVERSAEQLRKHDWEPRSEDGEVLSPCATPESKRASCSSVYALSKFDQERMCLTVGRAYGIPVVALRFFNIYGPYQALSNPYTGVLAIFASRLLNRKAPLINEDGAQERDFVSVYDVARACRLAMEVDGATGEVFNVGSGRRYTILELALRASAALGRNIAPQVTGKYRVGDIRHCFADLTRARTVLGYQPRVTLEEGLRDLAGWLDGQISYDRTAECVEELTSRGLMA
jgi:dTDP-L-rhamnose 4-epimerase